jgi:hypothetical protein
MSWFPYYLLPRDMVLPFVIARAVGAIIALLLLAGVLSQPKPAKDWLRERWEAEKRREKELAAKEAMRARVVKRYNARARR